LTVKVSGAVLQPGVYQIPPGSTVLEVIFLASPAEQADLDLFNLTDEVYDGQDISVPLKPADQTGSVTNESQSAKQPDSVGNPERNVFSPPSGTGSKTSGAASQKGSGSVTSSPAPAPASKSPVNGTEQSAGVSTKGYDSKKVN